MSWRRRVSFSHDCISLMSCGLGDSSTSPLQTMYDIEMICVLPLFRRPLSSSVVVSSPSIMNYHEHHQPCAWSCLQVVEVGSKSSSKIVDSEGPVGRKKSVRTTSSQSVATTNAASALGFVSVRKGKVLCSSYFYVSVTEFLSTRHHSCLI